MSQALRVQLLGKTDRVYQDGKLTLLVFNDFTRIPGRVIKKLVDNAIYLNADCEFKVEDRALQVCFQSIPEEPGKNGWSPKHEIKPLTLYFPISKVVEFGVMKILET